MSQALPAEISLRHRDWAAGERLGDGGGGSHSPAPPSAPARREGPWGSHLETICWGSSLKGKAFTLIVPKLPFFLPSFQGGRWQAPGRGTRVEIGSASISPWFSAAATAGQLQRREEPLLTREGSSWQVIYLLIMLLVAAIHSRPHSAECFAQISWAHILLIFFIFIFLFS